MSKQTDAVHLISSCFSFLNSYWGSIWYYNLACQDSVEDAIGRIQSGFHVFIHGQAATPKVLIAELVRQAPRLRNVTLYHLHTEGEVAYAKPELREHFRVRSLFVGANLRHSVNYDSVDYIPCFLSEIGALFRSRRIPLDAALIHVSPPDRHGYFSLGTGVDIARAAVESARLVIAQVNTRMPRLHGDGILARENVHAWVKVEDELPVYNSGTPGSDETKIGRQVASLIEDGSTLQAGIGAIPDAVMRELKSHRHLGVHTEMWSDGTLELLRCGAIDNSRKKTHPGKSVASFLMGSRELYDHVDDNPSVVLLEASYVNNPTVIARNPRVVAINSAVEVDLTGQVCADSVGHRIISGVGGQIDFMRGAMLSQGGKPIIAIASRTAKGTSRIVPALQSGAGAV